MNVTQLYARWEAGLDVSLPRRRASEAEEPEQALVPLDPSLVESLRHYGLDVTEAEQPKRVYRLLAIR